MASLERQDIDLRDPTVSAGSAVEITPDNDTDIPRYARGLYVGANGNVRVALARDDNPVTFVGVVAGTVLPIRPRRVYATGTTASDIIALY